MAAFLYLHTGAPTKKHADVCRDVVPEYVYGWDLSEITGFCIQRKVMFCAANSEIVEPGFALRSGFFGSLLYWSTVYGVGWLKPAEGAALVITIFVVHGVSSDLSGRPLDFTYPIAKGLHMATLVPMAKPVPKAGKQA